MASRHDSSPVPDPAENLPWARAVVRDGRITLNGWSPSLMTRGPARAVLLRSLPEGVVIADLTSDVRPDGREELIVRWVPDGRASDAARATVVGWAAVVGYRRVWLPDDVVDLGDAPSDAGRVATACPTCGAAWDDESPEFWLLVRSQGHFPGGCPICNGSLPEWTAASGSAECGGAGHPGDRSSRSPRVDAPR